MCRAALETLIRVAGQRWQIEQAFQTAKDECGLGHYEVRHWQDRYCRITLAMLARGACHFARTGRKSSKRAGAAHSS
jgi:SRSO17 transposase